MRALYIFLGCNLLAGLSPILQAAGEPTELLDLCRPDSLPQDIRSSLARNFSGWKIQEPTDLSTRARTRWGAERPLNCPGIAAGHFQDAKNASYALLLIPADHGSSAYRLLIFTGTDTRTTQPFNMIDPREVQILRQLHIRRAAVEHRAGKPPLPPRETLTTQCCNERLGSLQLTPRRQHAAGIPGATR